jgi:hypothetical protein
VVRVRVELSEARPRADGTGEFYRDRLREEAFEQFQGANLLSIDAAWPEMKWVVTAIYLVSWHEDPVRLERAHVDLKGMTDTSPDWKSVWVKNYGTDWELFPPGQG